MDKYENQIAEAETERAAVEQRRAVVLLAAAEGDEAAAKEADRLGKQGVALERKIADLQIVRGQAAEHVAAEEAVAAKKAAEAKFARAMDLRAQIEQHAANADEAVAELAKALSAMAEPIREIQALTHGRLSSEFIRFGLDVPAAVDTRLAELTPFSFKLVPFRTEAQKTVAGVLPERGWFESVARRSLLGDAAADAADAEAAAMRNARKAQEAADKGSHSTTNGPELAA